MISRSDAKRELERMRADPKPPVRRVVVVPGYRSHASLGRALGDSLRSVVSVPDWVIDQAHQSSGTFEDAGARVIGAIEEAWGTLDHEIDFVGVSMGGLLGRWLAMPEHGGLPIARLFTLSTPHRGANVARIAAPDPAARLMVPGSDGLAMLDAALEDASYEMLCYARSRDWWVGTDRLAPEGVSPVTVTPPWWEPGHFMASYDVRLIADVARHVRGEAPLYDRQRPGESVSGSARLACSSVTVRVGRSIVAMVQPPLRPSPSTYNAPST
ncbi:MAG: hypothetical protein AAGH64_02630 [Planctomycetota bacterium]